MKTSNSVSFTTDSVTSADGTTIGYRRLGDGPGVVLVHGGMQAAQNFMKLGAALSDAFTVYVPDRRGRGLSGPFGENYGIKKECDDIQALLRKTGAQNLFGLSAGAIISLQSALTLPEIHKVALYEPPLSHDAACVPRYDQESARGKLAAAMITLMKGTGDSSLVRAMPRFVLVPLMGLAIKAEAKSVKHGDTPVRDLIPTMHFDAQLVFEIEGALESFKAVPAEVLLLGGSKSARYLSRALDALGGVLPHAKRVQFPGVGHLAADNRGQPELVATELRRFFA